MLSDSTGAVHNRFCASSAPCMLLENMGVWFPVTFLEEQVPTPAGRRAARRARSSSFRPPRTRSPVPRKEFARFKLLLGEILSLVKRAHESDQQPFADTAHAGADPRLPAPQNSPSAEVLADLVSPRVLIHSPLDHLLFLVSF